MELKVNPEYEKLLPRLIHSEFSQLKESLRLNGQYLPIVVNGEGVVLDGHNRLRALQELGIEPKFEVKTFEDNLAEREYLVKVNLERRQLNDFQRAELGRVLFEIEKERAKQRMLDHGKTQEPLGSNDPGGRARDIVAKEVGLSPTTFQRATTVMDKASEELKDKVRKGETSITYAYKSVQNQQRHRETPPLPEGQFDIILADPPWEYDLPLRGSPDMHYQTMPLEELLKLKVPCAENAILFLWATNPKLQEALAVLDAWGFEYKTNMVWVKDKFGNGYYFRGQHELLLVGKKGVMPPPIEADRPSSVLNAPRQEHSHKPQEVYGIIERMYPNGTKLEMFAREKRDGWESWGNEL